MEGSFFLLFAALLVGWALRALYSFIRFGYFHHQANTIIQQAERTAHDLLEQTKTEILASSHDHEMKIKKVSGILENERLLLKQEKKIFKQDFEDFKKEQTLLERSKKTFSEKEHTLSLSLSEALRRLEAISKLSYEEAKKEIWQKAEADSEAILEKRTKNWESLFQKECQQRSFSILFSALERKAQSFTKETFLTDLPIENKAIPKIIGKEGRNIQALEELLGVLLIVDEEENKIRISAHDPKKRMIAKATLERVLNEEKVTPVTIKNAYEETFLSFPKLLEDRGREACKTLKIQDNFSPDLIRTLGSLSLRSSAGQNTLSHSVEVAELMGIISYELGLYAEKAKLMGLFHDIGKALSIEWGPSHALAGSAFLKNFGIEEIIFEAVASHHGEATLSSNEARLLPLCDRLSAQLPGVRKSQETFYFDLLRQAEEIAKNTPGVLSAWAHYGGSSIELIVRPEPKIASPALLSHLEQLFSSQALRLPVRVSLL